VRVLVIPEDPVKDRYILKPLVEQLFADLGRPQARVEVLENPRLRGVSEALSQQVLADIVDGPRNGMIDLFLVLIDRDGDRPGVAIEREREHPKRLHVCLAIEEIEVWMLALHRDRVAAPWSTVRAEPHPKEAFAEPFLSEHAPKGSPGRGRAWAMHALDRKAWRALLGVCPELEVLKQQVAALLASAA
jgi:hypothetical protein